MLDLVKKPLVKVGVPVTGAVVSALVLGPLHLVTLACVGVGLAAHFLVK